MNAHKMLVTLAVACSILVAAPLTYAQGGCGKGGWGPDGAYWRLFDTRTVTTLQGEITAIKEVAPVRGTGPGVHLDIKTDRDTVAVHLGPAWYVQNQEPSLQVKDRVQVKGSRVTVEGQTFVIASEVRKGDGVLTLRDDSGQPQWCGWRHKGRRSPNG